MADSNQLKRVEPIDFGNDDPFAELTRIMGFDPRQPSSQSSPKPVEPPRAEMVQRAPVVEARPVAVETARAPQPVVAPRPIVAPAVAATPEPELSDDFAIDLEQELLAGFDQALPEVEPAAAYVAPRVEAQVAYARPAVAAPQPVVEPDALDDLAFDLEDDFAVALEQELTDETAYSGEPTVAFEEPIDYRPTASRQEDRWPEPEAYRAPEQAAPITYADQQDDDDLLGELELALGDEPEHTVVAAALPAANGDQLQADLDLDFDLAMADVDMQFMRQTPTAADEQEALEVWEPQADPAEDLDRVIGELDSAAHSPSHVETVSYDRAPTFGGDTYALAEPEPVAEPEPEIDFEEELRALLRSPVQPAVLTAQYEPEPPVAETGWDAAQTAYATQPVSEENWAPQAADVDLDLADAFDEHAFDAAFERELAVENRPVAPRAASAPFVETVEVPEAGLAYTEELDIPDLHREDAVPAAIAYDEYEPDFADLYAEPAASRRDPEPVAAPRAVDPFEAALATTAAATAAISGARTGANRPTMAVDASFDPALRNPVEARQVVPNPPELDGFDQEFDDAFDRPLDFSDVEFDDDEPAPRRRGLLIAAVVAGVALISAVGAFALSFGGDGESQATVPALVRADPDPVKVRPEEPGGDMAPNADSKVFQTMTGKPAAESPAQERLLSNDEEPVDIASRSAIPGQGDAEATAKGEDRVLPTEEEASADAMEVAAVAPRRVKTMVVRPDGTLVAREEAPTEAVVTAEKPAPLETAMTLPGVVAEPAAPAVGKTPAEAPVAPARPSDQPIEVVGEVAPERVALATPAGGWAMQIASQPSEAAAKSTFDDLARRYGSVLGGKEASIVKAEIAGKGTFWRVRIGAATRNEAINLCEKYKAAGGSCFVSK